jgi:hypothetical protein
MQKIQNLYIMFHKTCHHVIGVLYIKQFIYIKDDNHKYYTTTIFIKR